MLDIIENQGYQYVSMGFAGLFLIPQIWRGYKTKQLRDVSSTSMIFIIVGSGLWTFYMYESEKNEYAGATLFVAINAIIVCVMQFYFWFTRVKEHLKTFDAPPQNGPVINIATESAHVDQL
jgi:uncharacterized protein with PQ loop repeat